MFWCTYSEKRREKQIFFQQRTIATIIVYLVVVSNHCVYCLSFSISCQSSLRLLPFLFHFTSIIWLQFSNHYYIRSWHRVRIRINIFLFVAFDLIFAAHCSARVNRLKLEISTIIKFIMWVWEWIRLKLHAPGLCVKHINKLRINFEIFIYCF